MAAINLPIPTGDLVPVPKDPYDIVFNPLPARDWKKLTRRGIEFVISPNAVVPHI